MIERKVPNGISLQYESINERISRLRKQTASLNRAKDRQSYQIPLQKYERPSQIDKIMKENKLRIDFNQTSKTDLDLQSILSPRRYGITKRMNQRFQTEDPKSQAQNAIENKVSTARMPGKITKNSTKRLQLQETNQNLKETPKFFA